MHQGNTNRSLTTRLMWHPRIQARKIKGLTLVEVAIVLIIAALVVAGVVVTGTLMMKQVRQGTAYTTAVAINADIITNCAKNPAVAPPLPAAAGFNVGNATLAIALTPADAGFCANTTTKEVKFTWTGSDISSGATSKYICTASLGTALVQCSES